MSKHNTMHTAGSTENLKCCKVILLRYNTIEHETLSTYILQEPAASNRRVKQLRCSRQAHSVSHKQQYTSKQTTWYTDHNIQNSKYFDWAVPAQLHATEDQQTSTSFSAVYSCKWPKITYIIVTQYLSVLRLATFLYQVPVQN